MFRLKQITKEFDATGSLCSQVNLFGFIDDDIFLTKSGDLGIILAIDGVDYECLDTNTIENLTGRLTAAFRLFDENCRVEAVSKLPPDSEIRFEVWMPASNWNGKFAGVGNGAMAGSISYSGMAAVLSRGYATSSTDTGHEGSNNDGSYALGHREKVLDLVTARFMK